MQIAHLD
jgi:uncharacterized protein YodC (DUF2158 family)